MSNYQDSTTHNDLTRGEALHDRNVPIELKLRICLFSEDKNFIDAVTAILSKNTYNLTLIDNRDSFIKFAQNQREKIDCLVLKDEAISCETLLKLQQKEFFLPIAIAISSEQTTLKETNNKGSQTFQDEDFLYHSAEIKFSLARLEQLPERINLALTKFLHLTPQNTLHKSTTKINSESIEANQESLRVQQRRLTEKLKERLGYLGVYYKRNSQDFYRNLTAAKQKKLHQQLAVEYRKIILNYFEDEPNLNQIIDSFVNLAFFSDVSVSKILEIHMVLMDEFAQQLKIEGRNEDILLDYRLALIDIIAHLCEMYRRSIPRDDIPLDALFKLD